MSTPIISEANTSETRTSATGISATGASRYRTGLPQLSDQLFLTDGGLETCLIFHDGIDLPHFAAYPLLETSDGRATLRRYLDPFLRCAREANVGFVIETPTWRANADWGKLLGHNAAALDRLNRVAIREAVEARTDAALTSPVVISGLIGPRGDGYVADTTTSPEQAAKYHSAQINTFADTAADLVTAITMTNSPEAIGIALAASAASIPVVLGFTVETDGRLPSGETLEDAIQAVDEATNAGPAYYMINCAHPTHFASILKPDAPWTARIRGLRANASTMSHAELDVATELDDGDPNDLAIRCQVLRDQICTLNVFGGCCGTDARHIEAMAKALRVNNS